MSHRRYPVFAIVAAAAVFPLCATAATINGGLHFSGDATITTDMSGNGTLTFDPVAGFSYTFTIDFGSGDFSSLTGGGSEVDLNAVSAPVNTPDLNILDFLTFVNDPGVSFTLEEVKAGIDGTAGCAAGPDLDNVGAVCSPAGTPYNLQDISGPPPPGSPFISTASFVVTGFIYDGVTDTPATISFSATDIQKSFEQILYDQENGTPDTITYGAQLLSGNATPEPATSSLMLGAGLLLAGTLFRNRHRRTR